MADELEFDPYYKWLGIRPKDRPLTHYRLLGLSPYEDDADVIQDAADRTMAHVRTYQTGKHSEFSQKILNELSTAKICLLNPQKKAAYDANLKAAAPPPQAVPPVAVPPVSAPPVAVAPEAGPPPISARPPAPKRTPKPVAMVEETEAEAVELTPLGPEKTGPNLPLMLGVGGGASFILLLVVVAALYMPSDSPPIGLTHVTPPVTPAPVTPAPGTNPDVTPNPNPAVVFPTPNPTPTPTPTPTKSGGVAIESVPAQPKSDVPESYLARNPGSLQTMMHANSVGAVAVTPDGRRAITSGADPFVRVWNLETGSVIHQMPGHTQMTWAVGISADGKRGVSGSFDHTIRVWDLEKGTSDRVLKGHEHWVVKLALSPDGKRILSPSYDHTVRLWDADTGETLRTLKGHRNSAVCAAFVPGTKLAVSGGGEPHNNNGPDRDNTLKIWNLETGELVRECKGHTLAIDSVTVTPDGKYAVTGGWDRTIRVWDLSNGSEVRRFEGHTGPVKGVSISRDQTWLASCSIDATVRLWDLEKGTPLASFPHTGAESVAFAGDRRILLSGGMDRAARLWRVPNEPRMDTTVVSNPPVGNPPGGQPRVPNVVDIGPIAAAPILEASEKLLARKPGSIKLLDHASESSVKAVISADGRRTLTDCRDGSIRLWDLETGDCIQSFPFFKDTTGLAISADGKRGAVGAIDAMLVRVWDLEKGVALHDLNCKEFAPARTTLAPDKVILSPDGSRLLLSMPGRGQTTVRFWNTDTGTQLRAIVQGPASGEARGSLPMAAPSVAFVPGTKWIVASASPPSSTPDVVRPDVLRVWNLETGQLVREIPHPVAISSVAAASDGRLVATGSEDGVLRLWDLVKGTELWRVKGHMGSIAAVAISGDQSLLATSHSDLLRVWELRSGQGVEALRQSSPHHVSFASDSRLLITGGRRDACLWRLPDNVLREPYQLAKSLDLMTALVDFDRRVASLPTKGAEPPEIAPPRVDTPRVVEKKLPVPDAAALGAARKTFKEVFADELKGKKSQDKLALARELLKRANSSDDDIPGRFVFLEEARDAANDAGDATISWQAIDAMDRWYEIDPVAMKSLALKDAARLTRTPPKTVAQMYRTLIDEAAEREDFESVAALVTSGIAQARKVSDNDLVTAMQNRGKELRDMRAEFLKLKAARDTLAATPDDAEAALLVGKHLCLAKNQWDEGLPLLAKSSEEVWKKLAQGEQAKPTQSDPQVDLGDLWWTEAEKEKSGLKSGMQRRAAFWYTKAKSSLSGLTRARIEKRLAEAPKPNMTGAGGTGDRPRELSDLVPNEPNRREKGRFVDRGEYVEDTQTGLLWQKDGDDSGRMNFPQAANFASNLRLGRVTGWRLPTAEELAGIFPAVDPPFRDSHFNPALPTPNTPGEWSSYWTSTNQSVAEDRATLYHWYGRGSANGCLGSRNVAYVRCVRDPLK